MSCVCFVNTMLALHPSCAQTHHNACICCARALSGTLLTQRRLHQSRDDRFIVKQLSAAERRSLKEIAPNYFAYLARAMRRRQPTCLAKIMGVFTVRALLTASAAVTAGACSMYGKALLASCVMLGGLNCYCFLQAWGQSHKTPLQSLPQSASPCCMPKCEHGSSWEVIVRRC